MPLSHMDWEVGIFLPEVLGSPGASLLLPDLLPRDPAWFSGSLLGTVARRKVREGQRKGSARGLVSGYSHVLLWGLLLVTHP